MYMFLSEMARIAACCAVAILSLLLLTINTDPSAAQLVKGCPLHGCKSSGSFSFMLPKVPGRNAVVLWHTRDVSSALPDSEAALGCAGNEFVVVCNTHTNNSIGYIGIDPLDGTVLWMDKILRDPALPLLMPSGDLIACDGEKLLYYFANGTVNGKQINFMYDFSPMYSIVSTDTQLLLHSASNGIILTYGLDGIVDASIYLNQTVGGVMGAFVPIAQPVIYDSRIYSLMRFKAGNTWTGETRLYAVDITNLMAPRLNVSWHIDLNQTSRHKPSASTKFSQQTKTESKLWTENYKILATDGMVYLLYPGFTESSSMNALWVIEDLGDHANVINKVDINDGHNFAVDDNLNFNQRPRKAAGRKRKMRSAGFQRSPHFSRKGVRKPQRVNKVDGNLRYYTKKKNQRTDAQRLIWVHYYDFDLLGVDAKGEQKAQIEMTSVLHCSEVRITSKVMLMTSTTNDTQTLAFGVYIGSAKTDEFIAMCYDYKVVNCMQDYFLVAVDTATSELMWLISTPDNVMITGQLVGVPTSLRMGGKQDMVVAYAQDKNGDRVLFSVGVIE